MNLFKKDKNKQLKNEVETIGVNPTLEELEMFFGRKIGDISSSMLKCYLLRVYADKVQRTCKTPD